jgi:putative flippase GtrA
VNLLLRELFGYGAASAIALAVDISILWMLVHFFSVGYVVASSASFMAGSVVAYELSIRIAFKRHRLAERNKELASFIAIGVGALTVNAVVMFIAVDVLAFHYLAAKCFAVVFTFACNFVARRQILFVAPT